MNRREAKLLIKRCISALGSLAVALGTSYAAPIAIDLVPTTLTGAPGDILMFNGTLTNSSSSTVFLNSAAINITGDFSPADLSALPFFFNAPFFLDAGEAAAAIDLFTVHIPNGLPGGPYLGQFTILGGLDEFALDIVGDARFTVEAASDVPEPGTLRLLAPVCGPATWILLLRPRLRRPRRQPS